MKRIALCFCAVFCFASTAHAQNVELSQTQQTYNEQGVQFSAQGKLEEALAKFRASLALGEANVIYLNIGRTLSKLGECKEAKEAYEKVGDSPQVSSPTPKEIDAVLGKYKSELPAVCPARLEITCEPEGVEVTVNGDAATCGSGFIEREPGDVKVMGTLGEETFEEAFTLGEGEKKTVAVMIDVPKEDVVIKDPNEGVKDGTDRGGMPTLKLVGLIVGGVGLATLATAIVIDQTELADAACYGDSPPSRCNEGEIDSPAELESTQTINKILFIGGGVLAATGIVLFVLPSKKEKATALQFTTQGGMPGVRLRGSF